MANPLAGIRVVAFEQAVAAPLCTRHLADLGARVIKVENPATRHVLDRLLAGADVVVQNLAPGAAARIGVDAASVTASHPRTVAVDLSGYGSDGPLSHKRAYDLLVQAEAGSCAITGWPGHLAKAGIPLADAGAGMYALSSILAALLARAHTGKGAMISVSMFDTVAEWMGPALHYTLHTGEVREPTGLGSPMVAPYGAYPTSDGQTVVLGTTNDQEWQRLARRLLDRPDLADDPRYAGNADRCKRRAELDEVIAAWTMQHTLAAVQASADEAEIGNGRLNSVPDLIAHPHLSARGRWQDVDSEVGAVPVLLPAFNSPDWTPRMDGVPALGQHTDSVLRDLGLTADETAELHRIGAV